MRYGLRTLLLLVAVLCVWLGLRVNAARRQHAAERTIERLGGRISYRYQVQHDSTGRTVINPTVPLPYPPWCRGLLEGVFPLAVDSVSLRDTEATDRDLECLHSLSQLRHLDLSNTKVTDDGLVIATRLPKLRSLVLIGTSIGDRGVEHLKGLPLEQLVLWKTHVTDAGVHHLGGMTTLRLLVLDETQITDAALEDVGQLVNLEDWLGLTQTGVTDAGLPHLVGLKKAKQINLIGTSVSNEGVRRLREALPRTMVSSR
jgi:hypothetical protein